MAWRAFTILAMAAMAMSTADTARADAMDRAAKRIKQIQQSFTTEEAKLYPAYRCFQLGRMQGTADRLVVEADILERQGKNPAKAKEMRASYEAIREFVDSYNDGFSCDSQFKARYNQLNPPGATILTQVHLAVMSTQTMSSQDQIVGCFNYGRLSMLASELNAMIKDRSRKGATVPARAFELRNQANAKVTREMPDCRVAPSTVRSSADGTLDI